MLEFDANGYLPPGIHDASLADIEMRFAQSEHRRGLYDQLRAWCAHMKAAGCQTVYIDGSFISAKEMPGDYDACWEGRGVDLDRIEGSLLMEHDTSLDDIKRTFGGDIRPARMSPPGTLRAYLDFFQKDRNGVAKGLVRVDLKGEKL